MVAREHPTKFAVWLDKQLNEQGMGVRTLARKISPEEHEPVRRAIYTYLSDGRMPQRPMRKRIADALGVEPSEMPDEDDEESSTMSIDELLRRRVSEIVFEVVQKGVA